MNKNFAFFLSCAVTVLGLASCSNKETDFMKPEEKTHTVVFNAQTPAAAETKTALHLQVIPDWRNTDVEDVHIFETETTSGGSYMMEASKVYMETPIDGNVSKARFTAEFDNATVIVNPPEMAETKASSSQFNYTAIMATREGDKYVIPSVQYPHEESLIDPKADFLVGRNNETYSQSLHEQQVGLDFLRPVALARLAITNLEGTKVTKVKMTTVTPITGYVTYDEVDFENKTVEQFNADESNYELTLLFPEGKKRTATFYAYFVCVPGKAQFSKVEVYTDQYVFTKTYATPGSVTLKAGDFMNIALDMTVKENNGVSRSELAAQTLTFIDADEQPVTAVDFDLYTDGSAEDFILPELVCEGVVDETLVTVTSSNEDVATVDEDGYVHLTGAIGEATITASVPGDDTHAAGTASYKITVTDSTPAPEAPKYYKAEELVDGQEYIIVSNGMAMTLEEKAEAETKASATYTLGAVAVEAADGVIETNENVAVWKASTQVEYYTNNDNTTEAGHFALKSGDVYLQRLSNQSEQTLIVGDVPSTGKYYVWDYDGEYLSHLSSATTTFYAGYSDGWVVVYNGTLPKVTLYSTTKPLTKQVISFGEQPVTAKYDLNGGQWTVAVPELTGAQTTVTYSSNNDAIEVDASTGAINITDDAKKGDKATITATAAQTEEYASAKATYTIEIIDSSEPQPTGTTYTLVTKQADVVDGKYLIVASDDAKIFDGTGTYHGGYTTIASEDAISIDGSKITITGETSAYDFTFAKSGEGFTITGVKGMIVCAANSGATDAQQTYITFAETGGSVFLQRGNLDEKALLFSTTRGNSSDEFWYYHKDNGIFKIGGSGNKAGNGIHLYFAGERAAQTIEYDQATDTYDLASETPYVAPGLTDTHNTSVTYASSDTNVATVDADGVVTPVGTGEATITATAVASAEYLSASTSFTLTVTNSNVPKYYKADEVVDGRQYLIVSNKYALKNNNGSAAATNLSSSFVEDVIQYDPASTELWTATVSSGQATFKNDTRNLYRSSSSISLSTSNSSSFTYDAENEYLTTKGSSSTYYLYYNNTNFAYSTSANKVALYSTVKPLPKWEISYDVTAAEYDLFTETWTPSKPALTSATTDVTYASSDETVATVSATGEITALKYGTATTITATAAADETHKKGVASFKLSVVNSDPDLPKYTKVTSTDGLTAGAKYLLVFEGLDGDTDGDGDPMVFRAILSSDGTQFAKATTSAQPVVIANNSTIVSDAMEDYQFTLESGYYLKANKANKYIYPGSSSNSSVMLAENSASHALTITFDNGIAEIKNGSRYLVWSVSSHYFSCNTEVSGQHSTGICLYKLEGTTPEPQTPTAQNLSFNPTSVSGKVGESVTKPTLTGAKTNVTYSSSNTSFVDVDASTGALTLKAEGTATITATAAAGMADGVNYAEGSATYTVTVSPADPAPSGKTYKRVSFATGITTGKYLIVNPAEAKVFTTVTSNPNAADVTPASGVITGNYSDYEMTITKSGSNYTIQNGSGQYLYYVYTSGETQTRVAYKSSSENWEAASVSDDANGFDLNCSGGTDRQHIYWNVPSSGTPFFKLGSKSTGVHLYKLDDGGTTPEPPTPGSSTVSYTKVSSITSGSSYLIVSPNDSWMFTGTTAGGVTTVSPSDGVITPSSNDAYSAYEFVITEESGGTYNIKFGDQYLYCTGNFNNNSPAIGYKSTAESLTLDNTNISNDNYAFGLKMYANNGDQYLYFKSSSLFKWGGSGKSEGIHLYKKTVTE